MTNYLYLAIAIAAEVVATTSLKAVAGFSKPLPLLLVVGGYVLAFSMLVLVMRTLPVGVVYAIWSGLGIVLVSLVAMFVYGQRLDPAALLGIGLIITMCSGRRCMAGCSRPSSRSSASLPAPALSTTRWARISRPSTHRPASSRPSRSGSMRSPASRLSPASSARRRP